MSVLYFDVAVSRRGRALLDARRVPLKENHITFLLGESGIGKTLLAKSIYGLLDPDEFAATVNNEPFARYRDSWWTSHVRSHGFFVFQEASSHLNPLMNLEAQVYEGIGRGTTDASGILRRLWDDAPADVIDRILSVFPKPFRPSGGEKQRILLTMAFLRLDRLLHQAERGEVALFVFDEPTGSLDTQHRDLVLSMLFERFRERRFTALYITHDYSVIGRISKAHRRFLGDVSFLEMRNEASHAKLTEFSTERYLEWIRRQRRIRKEFAPRASSDQPLLTVEGPIEIHDRVLYVSKDSDGKRVVPLEVWPREITYLKGPSGIGKTMFAKSLMRLLSPTTMRFRFHGGEFDALTPTRVWRASLWGKGLTMSFQHADEALNPHSTVRGVFEGLPAFESQPGGRVREHLGMLFDEHLTAEFLNRKTRDLSGGQKQKLNLLRSFYLGADVTILDEPMNGLDFESMTRVVELMRRQQRNERGILLISHNEEIFDSLIPPEQAYYMHAGPAGAPL